MSRFLFILTISVCCHIVTAQENLYDLLGIDMVDTTEYEDKIMFYEDLPFNMLNKRR